VQPLAHEHVSSHVKHALKLDGVSVLYRGAAQPVLERVSMQLARGEQVLLRGGSGSGKSTLLMVIAGLMAPSAGEIVLGDAEGEGGAGTSLYRVSAGQRDALRGSTIGMIFQTFQLLAGFSASENVQAALMFSRVPAREHEPRALAMLAQLGITEPHKEVGMLSVGQQQRVAVARAVVCRPTVVLADEPTASLDPQNAAQAVKVIRSACRDAGAALLLASHDPSVGEGEQEPFERTLVVRDRGVFDIQHDLTAAGLAGGIR